MASDNADKDKAPRKVDKSLQPFPLRRRWNANIILGAGGYDAYVEAVNQPGEAPDDMRMPNETKDGIGGGAVKIKPWKDRPEDGEWCKSSLFPQTERVQSHEFLNELKHPVAPFAVDMSAYLLAPTSNAFRDRIMTHEQLFRKAGIPARHLQFLPDFYASERLPWERTRHGWYGGVSNLAYQELVERRDFDRYGGQWYVPHEARRKRSDFEVALAMQLQPSEAEQKTFGMADHYGLSEQEQEVGARKKFRTPDEDVGFAVRKFGPPGLAEPLLVSNSLGNHRFHSYNGAWKRGRMHGSGTYKFADDMEYVGLWRDGSREGYGETEFTDGSSYKGHYSQGLMSGYGELDYASGSVYKGNWQKGMRHGKGKMTYRTSGQTFEGEFYAGRRHGHCVHASPKTGVSFEGSYAKGNIQGNGSLIFKDKKTGKQRRIRRGLWHKSEFAPAGQINLKDLVMIVDKEDSKKTREKSTDYVQIHGTVLAAQLNEWCYNVKKECRDKRMAKKEAESEETRQKLIDKKNQLAELRKQAREAKEKAANDSDFENDSDEEGGADGAKKDDNDDSD